MMIEPEERNFCADGIVIGDRNSAVMTKGSLQLFLYPKKGEIELMPEENIIFREEKRGLSRERRAFENKFAEEHKKCSDDELLDMVKEKAEELGRAPKKHEVLGFVLIKSRFGPWPRVLEKAGLKNPKVKRGNKG